MIDPTKDFIGLIITTVKASILVEECMIKLQQHIIALYPKPEMYKK
jgi:hypothetical protein